MITKVKANKSFRGTTKYVLEKEKAKIIGGNMYGRSTNELVEQFTLSAHLNPQLKDPCYHLMLSVPKTDRTLNDDELSNLSQKHFANIIVLSQLKGDESQVKQPDKRIADTKLNQLVDEFIESELPAYDFFIARHSDKEHDHTHIVASRVNNLDGKSIRTWNNYAHSEHSARLLEREFKLTPVQSSWESKQKAMTRNQLERVERDGLPGEQIMRRAIEQVAADKPTMPQLIEQLWREHQVKSIVSYYGHGGVRGIKFGIDIGSVNEDGSPRLLWKQGGNLNKYKCSFTKLQSELGITYDPIRDDSKIKRLNNFLESVDNSQVNQQLISTIFPKEAQFIAQNKHQLNPATSDTEQRASSELINTISDFIEQSAVESILSETLPQLAEQLSQYNQQLSAGRTAFDELSSAITQELQSHTEKKAILSISDYIEQSTVESALTEAVLELTQQLSQYKEELVTAKATFNDLDAVLATELKSYLEKKAILSISDYIEQSAVESALTEAVLELTKQLSQYKEELVTAKATFNDLDAVLATELKSYLEKKAILSISDYIEQSTVESALTEAVLELTQRLSQYKEQLSAGRTTFDDLELVINTELQSHIEKKAILSISDYVEQSTVESALTETVLELTQQLSQYKEQLVIAKTTFNDLDAVLATELQSYLEKRAISSISDYVEQSTVESALTETVLELTQQLSQNQQQLSAGRTIFDDLEAAIVYLEQLHRSQKPVDAIALNQTPSITTDKPKLKEELSAELYKYYSADLQNLLVTDRDKEIAIRALLDNKPHQDVEEILFASPAGWTQDEAKELVLIASNQLATQKSEPEQSFDENQRIESELLAMAVPIAVELINWQLRETGSNSLRFKRATLEKQGRELVFSHDERGEIFRVAVNRNQSGELEYSPINVGEVKNEDLNFWQEADRILQQIISEKQQQSIRQNKGISL
ncbi:relaxase/mobilization nuclease domain-containing protein [Nostoc sp. 'Peltigera membranacea cyanobiont' N6]|uniref:relaxase/mobilization nuclease domain-containing protein n=1 Tax=Nostoc sp. 'Peltigera membranacea cyanobiont' N6 TaxID=1261031 RepID=UPI000CF31755|nr:relaxase/mobilization nuclease domain-containing protein [Nostoc sp. 'Peltigera membranacea cyanobiont' N6]AVH68532.1 relaxase [Nostoc sp. 'Peltigera membranacea cyanobiont' N6]